MAKSCSSISQHDTTILILYSFIVSSSILGFRYIHLPIRENFPELILSVHILLTRFTQWKIVIVMKIFSWIIDCQSTIDYYQSILSIVISPISPESYPANTCNIHQYWVLTITPIIYSQSMIPYSCESSIYILFHRYW